jgi:hypothetical protein
MSTINTVLGKPMEIERLHEVINVRAGAEGHTPMIVGDSRDDQPPIQVGTRMPGSQRAIVGIT